MRLVDKLNPDVYYQAEIDGVDAKYFFAPTFSKETYLNKLDELPTVGYQHNGEDIGGAVLVGNKLHLAVIRKYRGKWAFLLKPTLLWAFSFHNPLIVSISRNNHSAIRLLDIKCLVSCFKESKDGMNTYQISPKGLI